VQIRKAMVEGDADFGVMPSGQVCGRIDDIPSVEELVERIVCQAQSLLDSMRNKMVAP
jgi:NAD(P)H-dependent flavin oxidoreductase YrpB (nitropropane dioxygenase family)